MTDRPEANFASLFEAETTPAGNVRPREAEIGERCRAEVMQLGRDGVFLEILDLGGSGRRQQAFMNLADVRAKNGEVSIKVGDVLEALVVEVDARSGGLRLGLGMGRPAGLDELATAHAARMAIDGTVTGINKGGLDVEVAGMRAFCPISQADRGFVTDPQTLVGRTLQFLVTEFREGGKRVVLSRRAALEQEAKEAAKRILAQLVPGTVVRGSVTSVREFGAFVDLGGVEGLIPNAELSHDRGAKAADLLAPGDAVDVQILEIKPGSVDKRGEPTTKISLSLKALAADPWDDVEALAPVGKVVRGTVTRLLDFGAFIRLAPGLEGLLHISELGGKVSHPGSVLKVGEELNIVIRSIDRAQKRIALVPAPEGLELGSESAGPRFVIGTVVQGAVDRIETYGVFVQIEGTSGRAGRGLIPNAELGTPRGSDTRKAFPIGKRVTVKILETGDGRLRLSVRGAEEDKERAEFDGYRQNAGSAKLGTLADLLKSPAKKPLPPNRK